MAINKNFVVKNGLEVNNQLIYADADINRVGIASTQPRVELDVRGGIAATSVSVSGVSTVKSELRVGAGIAGTVFTVLGVDNLVGVGTSQPAYILDVRAPVSTGQTALYVHGDVRITGDINLDDINLDNAQINSLVVAGMSTYSGNLDINADIDVFSKSRLNELEVSGLSTFVSNIDINADVDINKSLSINSGLAVTGVSTFTGLVDINGGTNVTGISTFNNDILASESVSVIGGLSVTGLSTFTGIGTFLGDLYVGGDLYVADDLTFDQFTARKASITGLATAANLEVVGVTTLGNVQITIGGTGGIITATSGIVTYYGDGQFLQNIVVGVGIASTNPSTGYSEVVGYGATVITFAGPGISTNYPITVDPVSGIATVTIEGGGKGSISISTIAPFGARSGDLWYNPNYGRTFIYYDESVVGYGTDVYWVDAAPFNVGIITSLTNVSFSPGSALNPSIYFLGDFTTGFFSPSFGELTAVSTGSSILNINSGGINVTGVVTATAFVGDGSGLTGTGSTVFDDTTTNQEFFPLFTSTTSGTITSSGISTSKLTYNPSSGELTAVDYNSTSDFNLKTNIQTVENALDIVNNLRGVSFEWKENGNKSYGVIAQEIEKVLPELVKGDRPKTVSYLGIIGVLIESIKDLKKEIEELKKTK